jgi:membrane fusion protein (multidrug efflux system)
VQAAEKVAEAQLASALNAVNEKIALIRVRAAELALARQRLEDAEIVAPFCGIVQQRHVAPGSFVQVGQAIVTLVRTHPLRYRGVLPERYAHWLSIDQPVRVMLPAGADPCLSQVSRISPSLDPASRSLTFEAEVDNAGGRLRAGQFAEATVEIDSNRQALVVPAGAIVEFAGTEKVWKVADGRCREHPVQTGERREGWVEIVHGLSAGDVILVDGGLGREARVRPQTWLALRADAPALIVQSPPGAQPAPAHPPADTTSRRPVAPAEGEDLPSSPHAAGP